MNKTNFAIQWIAIYSGGTVTHSAQMDADCSIYRGYFMPALGYTNFIFELRVENSLTTK